MSNNDAMSDPLALELLTSIDASLKALVAQGRKATAPTSLVASDADLDGKYGDPELRFLPRDWTGESFKGRRFSECPADLLMLVASAYDYFADKAELANEKTSNGKPVAPFKRADAARARGWAVRNQHHPPASGDVAETHDQPDLNW